MAIMTLVAGGTGLPIRLEVAVLTDLAHALAATAPRGCAVRVLTASDYPELTFTNLRVWQEYLPFSAAVFARLWRINAFSKPGQAELVHTLSPFAPLHPAGPQTIVTVPFLEAETLDSVAATSTDKTVQAYLKRAAVYADMLVVPDFHTATLLQTHYAVPDVRVLSDAAPSVLFNVVSDSLCKVPDVDSGDYVLVPATTSTDRITELLQVLAANSQLPQKVAVGVLPGQQKPKQPLPAESAVVCAKDFAGFAGILAEAGLLLLADPAPADRYLAHAALNFGVPVVHAEVPQIAEVVADAGYSYTDEISLEAALTDLYTSSDAYAVARVRARDRAGCHSWEFTAAALWQLHAEL